MIERTRQWVEILESTDWEAEYIQQQLNEIERKSESPPYCECGGYVVVNDDGRLDFYDVPNLNETFSSLCYGLYAQNLSFDEIVQYRNRLHEEFKKLEIVNEEVHKDRDVFCGRSTDKVKDELEKIDRYISKLERSPDIIDDLRLASLAILDISNNIYFEDPIACDRLRNRIPNFDDRAFKYHTHYSPLVERFYSGGLDDNHAMGPSDSDLDLSKEHGPSLIFTFDTRDGKKNRTVYLLEDGKSKLLYGKPEQSETQRNREKKKRKIKQNIQRVAIPLLVGVGLGLLAPKIGIGLWNLYRNSRTQN